MYRDDLASEAGRADLLQREIAALETKLTAQRAAGELIEREGRRGRYGLLLRWWGLALVLAALGGGFALGHYGSVRGPIEERPCP